MKDDLVLDDAEVQKLTGYKRHAQQLAELHRLGFWRARRAPVTGRVILERAHYEAVCAGEAAPAGRGREKPRASILSPA